MIVDPDRVAALIAEIAEDVIAPRFGALTRDQIDTKTGPNDFVTEADREAEEKLARALGDVYPAAHFIGEERAADDASLLDALGDEGAFWIVDPLDGTRNFVQGRAEFGSIIALVENGEIRNGWIYAIPDKAFAMGSKGDGATWRGEALEPVAQSGRPRKGFRAIGNLAEPWKSQVVPRLRAKYETDPAKCSAYVYIYLVRGLSDFAVYSRVHPWDHAAGVLMVREIGGRAAFLDNETPYAPFPSQGRPLLVTSAAGAWAGMRDVLLPGG